MNLVKLILFIGCVLPFNFATAIPFILKNDNGEKRVITDKQALKPKLNNIVFGVVAKAHYTTMCLMNNVAQAIASEMNIRITLKRYPSKRLSSMLERGEIHGDFSRIDGYKLIAPSALKVSTPIAQIPSFPYSLESNNLVITGWDSIKKYKIAVTRGHSLYKKYLIGHDIHFLQSDKATFDFVKAGRADLLVADTVTANFIIQSDAPLFNSIKKAGPSLGVMNFHTYISPKYPEFVDRYNEALKKLVKTKGYNKLFSEESLTACM